jgi:hypothetical protein
VPGVRLRGRGGRFECYLRRRKPRDRAVDEGMWRDAQPWKRRDAPQADDELASPAWARFDGLTPLALIACLTIGLARPLQDNVPRKIHPSSLSQRGEG